MSQPCTAALQLINLERYPLHQPDSLAYREVLSVVAKAMQNLGCARLEGFVNDSHTPALAAEVAAIADQAHFSNGMITPYFNEDDPTLPAAHPRRRFATFSNGFVAMDRFPVNGLCLSLYHEPHFQRFIADCLGEPELYTFDDPLAGVVANIMPEQAALPWHFDTNEFIVSLLTRKPESGGRFEYCPGLRQPGDECYTEVQSVLDGERQQVRSLDLELGDLQLFRGRFSMHRVVPCQGERHTVIFGYAKQPGFIGRVQRTMAVHNRVTQAHIDAEAVARHDGLSD